MKEDGLPQRLSTAIDSNGLRFAHDFILGNWYPTEYVVKKPRTWFEERSDRCIKKNGKRLSRVEFDNVIGKVWDDWIIDEGARREKIRAEKVPVVETANNQLFSVDNVAIKKTDSEEISLQIQIDKDKAKEKAEDYRKWKRPESPQEFAEGLLSCLRGEYYAPFLRPELIPQECIERHLPKMNKTIYSQKDCVDYLNGEIWKHYKGKGKPMLYKVPRKSIERVLQECDSMKGQKNDE